MQEQIAEAALQPRALGKLPAPVVVDQVVRGLRDIALEILDRLVLDGPDGAQLRDQTEMQRGRDVLGVFPGK